MANGRAGRTFPDTTPGENAGRPSGIEIQSQPGSRPAAFEELAGGRAGDPGIAHVRSAEADVGGDEVRKGEVLDPAVEVEGGDAAVDDRRHADLAAGLHRQAVEQLERHCQSK